MYSQETIQRFQRLATASVADAADKIAGKTCYMTYDVKPQINDKKVVGPAVTILEGPTTEFLPPTHALEAIDASNEGDVLVIGVEGSDKNVAVWGGLMTAGAVVNKMAGAILDAGVRDVTEIRRDFDFPVYARSISPGTTLGRYKTLGSNVPVSCGGIEVHPGDLIIADLDGVVVVPKEHVEAVLAAAEEIEAREAEQTKYIRETGSLIQGIAKYNRI